MNVKLKFGRKKRFFLVFLIFLNIILLQGYNVEAKVPDPDDLVKNIIIEKTHKWNFIVEASVTQELDVYSVGSTGKYSYVASYKLYEKHPFVALYSISTCANYDYPSSDRIYHAQTRGVFSYLWDEWVIEVNCYYSELTHESWTTYMIYAR